ncbi:hypothetical protein Cantr_04111 [Candida viswanathii]|uniref:GAF domain-containing protein n=1 Tax=Candida viswanathii TaxID=5486 RepID=A0A367XRQ1_9ASCO|nr:hypothetical protein Cantr_04111 [Candida viswanathii]
MSNRPSKESSRRNKKFKRIVTSSSSRLIPIKTPQLSLLAASPGDLVLTPIQLTKSHFIDAYCKGKWNLSRIPCPPCMPNKGYMKPPESYNEPSRLDAVARYMDLPHWHEMTIFRRCLSKLRKNFQVPGVALSMIDNYKCHFKIETMLNTNYVPRCIAIESHAILSQGYFLLLDASKDRRTRTNPLITSSPYIRFWCGVPLITSNQEVIGVLSIFDRFPKDLFSEENCTILQLVSKEIMEMLETPLNEVLLKMSKYSPKPNNIEYFPAHNDLKELQKQIGRPTSSKSSLVFEKDGSGGRYSQNNNYRFIKYGPTSTTKLKDSSDTVKEEQSTAMVKERELWLFLFSVGSLKKAGTVLSKVLATNYHFEFVYILEIRIAEPYQISREYFPLSGEKVEAEAFEHFNMLIKRKNSQNEFMTRVIGFHGTNFTTQHFESSIHYKAFMSEFGVEYRNAKGNSVYNRGMLLPFFRNNSVLVRKSGPPTDGKMIDVYLRSGGYILALFSTNVYKDINNDLVANIFNHACTFRKIYICT